MVDPNNVTITDRTIFELEEFLLFGLVVQGKTSSVQAEKLERFLNMEDGETPFEKIRKMVQKGTLEQNLRAVKMGKYNRFPRAMKELSEAMFDLRTVSTTELESIYSIGKKTSRFFIMHTRKDPSYACLDVHVLAWLDELGYDVPLKTPTDDEEYERCTEYFLQEAKNRGKHPADFDLEIWAERSSK